MVARRSLSAANRDKSVREGRGAIGCATFSMVGFMKIKRIGVKSSAGTYAIVCGEKALRQASREIAKLGKFSSMQFISSPKVWRAVGDDVLAGFRLSRCPLHLMDDAESAKSLKTVEALARTLVNAGADRKSVLIAVGGGVVGDVAGFVAASYLRGVALVHIPTTIVAQVDSSIGGKTGVNLPEGKNLVGAFYPPGLVLTDPETLRSLPEREFRGGLAEIIKHAVIADLAMFAYLEKNLEKLERRDRGALAYLIPRNVEIKARIVGRDERESGLRELLNFGHTFAHALENVTEYCRYQHGEAVAWGMMAAALLGHEAGITSANDVSRIVSLVRRLAPLPPWPETSVKTLVDAMGSDKKSRGGKLRFVLTPRIGKAAAYDDVPLDALERVLRFAPHFFCDSNCRARVAHKSRKMHG
jgi:3-dehydroquinate synthase